MLIHPCAVLFLALGLCLLVVPWLGIPCLLVAALFQAQYVSARRMYRREMTEKERARRIASWRSL